MNIHRLIFRQALQKIIKRLMKNELYYRDLKVSVAGQNIIDSSAFQKLFDVADIIYDFLRTPDFVKKFEEDAEVCDSFIELNLYMVAVYKNMLLETKSDKNVNRFMEGKGHGFYCKTFVMLTAPYRICL